MWPSTSYCPSRSSAPSYTRWRAPRARRLPRARLSVMRNLLAALLASVIAPWAAAQDYPVREIRSVCNFAAGSGADIIVRYYSDKLSRLTGKPVIVENKPGAQGLVATDFVAKLRPDGYTIIYMADSMLLVTRTYIIKHITFYHSSEY